MMTRASSCTSGPLRSSVMSASALLIVISSRTSSSSAIARASSYSASASSISFARTFASADWRSSSTRFMIERSDIATLALTRVCIPRVILLLTPFEFNEIFDFFLRSGAERFEPVEHVRTAGAFIEEVADAQIERLQDLEERVETDFVLSLLHPREVGLVNADTLRKLHLREFFLAAKLPDLASDEFELGWLVHAGFVDFLCCGEIKSQRSIYGLRSVLVKPRPRFPRI